LHRAILGSLERFIGILIENYAGKFPLWLAPVQVVIAGITNEFDEHILKILKKFQESGIRAQADLDAQKISYKIRHHSLQKVPYIAVIGKKEIENNSLAVRKLGEEDQQIFNIDDFIEFISKQISDKLI